MVLTEPSPCCGLRASLTLGMERGGFGRVGVWAKGVGLTAVESFFGGGVSEVRPKELEKGSWAEAVSAGCVFTDHRRGFCLKDLSREPPFSISRF